MKLKEIRILFVLIVSLVIIVPMTLTAQQQKSKQKALPPFATVVSSDAVNNYLSVDLTELPVFLERAILLDLVFADPHLVVKVTDISGSKLELFSDKLNDIGLVLKSLDSYRDKAIHDNKTLDEGKKKQLLKKYSKFR
ncbi:MAG: hypothetical protein HXX13_04775 [Bacteroidetes bacterium]|nr:hypothetical protein [Bacteroidota bacterium]